VAVKVFLLGRPGSGKTSAFYMLKKIARKKKKKAIRFREYAILRDMTREDGYKDKFCASEFGGFDILDFSVFDESAKRLEKRIQSYLTETSTSNKNELIFVELARDDYSKAMKCFSPEFLKDAYFLFTEANIEICIKRIQYRVAHPRKTDGHYVSDYIVKGYYSKHNLPYMDSKFRLEYNIQKYVMAIENTGSLQKLAKMIKYFAKVIFTREFSEPEEAVIRESSNLEKTCWIYLQRLMYGLIMCPVAIFAIPAFIYLIYQKFAKMIKYFAKVTFTREFSEPEETVTWESSNPEKTRRIYLQRLMYGLITCPVAIFAIPTFIHFMYMLTGIALYIFILLINFFFVYQNLKIRFSDYKILKSGDLWDSTQLWKSPTLWEMQG
jgi:hypothetical protein